VKIQICVPIAAKNPSELPPMIEKAEDEGADLIEIRLDSLRSIEGIEKIVEYASVPLIATNRQYEQGGYRVQDEEPRIQNLIRAAERGFQYADVELTTRGLRGVTSRLRDIDVKPIVSFHDFTRTPSLSEMRKIIEDQMKADAEVCKLITTANDVEDNIPCLLLLSEMHRKAKIVCFAMGEKGLMSRALSPVFGGFFTYASMEKGLETAPGQITIPELKELYKTLGC